MTTNHVKQALQPYTRQGTISDSLLSKVPNLAREIMYGTLEDEVARLPAFKSAAEAKGWGVTIHTKKRDELLPLLVQSLFGRNKRVANKLKESHPTLEQCQAEVEAALQDSCRCQRQAADQCKCVYYYGIQLSPPSTREALNVLRPVHSMVRS